MDIRFEKGSKEVLVRIEDRDEENDKNAIVMWRTIKNKLAQKESGETTSLFYMVDAYLNKYADRHQTTIHFLFSTSNDKLKAWFINNYQVFGFSNLREKEGVLAADKYYGK